MDLGGEVGDITARTTTHMVCVRRRGGWSDMKVSSRAGIAATARDSHIVLTPRNEALGAERAYQAHRPTSMSCVGDNKSVKRDSSVVGCSMKKGPKQW